MITASVSWLVLLYPALARMFDAVAVPHPEQVRLLALAQDDRVNTF